MRKSWGIQLKLKGRKVKSQTNPLRFLFGSEGSQITPQVPSVPLNLGR